MLVNLKKRVKLKGKWTFVSVPRKNGRFQPEKVQIAGVYYLEWRPAGTDGKRRQERIGASPREALEALYNKQTELNDANPQTASDDPSIGPTIEEGCAAYLTTVKATRSEGTARSYAAIVEWFKANIQKVHVSQITRDDIIRLFARGREQSLNQKTINKRVVVALGIIRNAGYDVKLKKGDWPKTSDTEPEVYDLKELKKFFSKCDERDRVMFSVFLNTGFRYMEVATLEWSGDVDWKHNTLTVRAKPHLQFSPKSYESRRVRVPKALMDMLKDWQKKNTGKTDLVFPTRVHPKNKKLGGAEIDSKILERCKQIAFEAGLNCKTCETASGRCAEGPYCERWFLHKFRHTFATNMLRDGVDIKSLQSLLGHKSLATTEKYLKSLRLQEMESKVENSTLAKLL